jgi:hypothetical protein
MKNSNRTLIKIAFIAWRQGGSLCADSGGQHLPLVLFLMWLFARTFPYSPPFPL